MIKPRFIQRTKLIECKKKLCLCKPNAAIIIGSRQFGKIASRQLKIYDSQWNLGTCNLIAIRIQLESVYCGGFEVYKQPAISEMR